MMLSMKYVKSSGTVVCHMPLEGDIVLPIIPGILKHPRPDELPGLLKKPDVARKYTQAALRKSSWHILKQFPRPWLRVCLKDTSMPNGRRGALRFILDGVDDKND